MNVAYFGTSDRSTPILEAFKKNFKLKLCVTKADTKIGRDQITKESGVKKWAKENKVDFLAVDNLKGGDLSKVIEQIKDTEVEIGIVADFSFIIAEEIINLFKGKLINVHFSLLPKYRGASPVQFAISNGDKVTGITFYIVTKELDCGDILFQIEYKMTDKETSGELYSTLFSQAAKKLPKIIKDYDKGKITPLPQDNSQATYTYSKSHPKSTFIYKDDAQINWNEPPEKIDRIIRAYNPWPIAWTYLSDMEKAHNLKAGCIHFRKSIDRKLKLKIYEAEVINGKLEIKKLQIEGKKRFDWKDLVNGYLETASV